jgi:hypothetical protein
MNKFKINESVFLLQDVINGILNGTNILKLKWYKIHQIELVERFNGDLTVKYTLISNTSSINAYQSDLVRQDDIQELKEQLFERLRD